MKPALIIFVRKPEAGKVKTRLAATVGADAALTIYKKLLDHTYNITAPLSADKYVFYADEMVDDDRWSIGYFKALQGQGNLGQRMETAFRFLFEKGYDRICIVGSDCFELTTAIVMEAFSLLADKDIVVGPAKDGGYYLLGMKENIKAVFDDIEWSTGNVFLQTEEKIRQQQLTYALLPPLNDVDTEKDVPKNILQEANIFR